MSLILIMEDGSGKPDANSYASAGDGDAYHDGHGYASAWAAATTASKEAALVMATRLIDARYQFHGWKTNPGQALQWPRVLARDPDRAPARMGVTGNRGCACFDSDQVPRAVAAATCELARELLKADRTENPEGEGIAQFTLVGALNITFNPQDRAPVMTRVVRMMLGKVGRLAEGGGGVRVVRR